MTMIGWFLMAVFALVASVALWWAESLQRENGRLREKNFRLERERREEIEYQEYLVASGMEVVRDILDKEENFSPNDPATILEFPENDVRRA